MDQKGSSCIGPHGRVGPGELSHPHPNKIYVFWLSSFVLWLQDAYLVVLRSHQSPWTLRLFQNDWTGAWVNGSLRLGFQARLNLQLIKVVILITLAFKSYSFAFNLTSILYYLVKLSNQRFTHQYKGLGPA